MSKHILIPGVCVWGVLAVCCAGCNSAAQEPAGYDFPTTPPIWIVEDDPTRTIFERQDLERDRKVGKMLVIPLYKGYRHEGKPDNLAIAHPFVYQQGEEIEKQLAGLGQRENLRALTIWVPGFFPDSIGRTFPWVPVINKKKMIVLELQPCIGLEEIQINAAMKTLLQEDFTIAEQISRKCPPPPYTNESRMTEDPYDILRLVRAVGYEGRFYQRTWALNNHVLWAFPAGTPITNRLSPEEKKMVVEFAEEAEKARAKQAPDTQLE